jgi:ribose transport system ATP-binding protein
LKVRDLSLPGCFENVSFSVRGGEIVGLGELVGAGRSEIAEIIFGLRAASRGRVVVDGVELRPEVQTEMVEL